MFLMTNGRQRPTAHALTYGAPLFYIIFSMSYMREMIVTRASTWLEMVNPVCPNQKLMYIFYVQPKYYMLCTSLHAHIILMNIKI